MSAAGPLAALAASLVASLVPGACGHGASDAPRSVLLVTLDTTRADALTCLGGRPGLTPNLDRLAAEGVLFRHAFATVPLTLPSHTSMLTGLVPLRSGVRDNGHDVLPAAADTVAERAAAAGVQTAAFLSASVLHPDFGLGQGFAVYDAPADEGVRMTTEYPSRRSTEVVALALDWLAHRDRSRPFFLWVHVWDPHAPWQAPAEFHARAPGEPYLQEVASADAAVGRLVDALRAEGVLDATTVIAVGDHGESLGEHGEESHGVFCYDATMHVPLVVRPAAGTPLAALRGHAVDGVASVVDVAPTVLDALGLPPLPGIDGLDLANPLPADRGAYLESTYAYRAFGWSPITGWRTADAKYLASARPELYDLARDPGEADDLLSREPVPPSAAATVAADREAIAAVAARPRLERDATPSDARRADLQALGYAAGGGDAGATPEPLAPSDRPAPRDRAPLLAEMETAQRLLSSGQYVAAERAYTAILARDPDNLWCLELYATSLLAQSRPADALAPLQRVVDAGRGTAITWGNLGHVLRAVGRPDDAIAAFEHALDLNPVREGALKALRALCAQQGRPEEAAPYVRRFEERTGGKQGG